MDDLEQKVKKIIAEQLGKNEADIKNEASFIEDLGADSLDTVATREKFSEGPQISGPFLCPLKACVHTAGALKHKD